MGAIKAQNAVQPGNATAPIDCRRCEAVCCRLPVWLMPGDDVPRWMIDSDGPGGQRMAQNEEGWCVAIDPYHLRCTIHPQRPAICRQFEMGGQDCRSERQAYQDQAQDRASPST